MLGLASATDDSKSPFAAEYSTDSIEEIDQPTAGCALNLEENNKLKLKIEELESDLQRQKVEFEGLKSLIYD